ncbi:transposase [Candidatus Vondammii sp. HM_W22]
MFNVLILQHLSNLNDSQTEFQIRDRYSFCRFPGRNGAMDLLQCLRHW